MSDNVNVLIVGAGNIAKEYCKVIKDMGISPIVIGRGQESAKKFEEEMDVKVIAGGLTSGIKLLSERPTHAIVAVNIDQLFETTKLLIEEGVKNILVEKPAGMDKEQIHMLSNMADEMHCTVYVAYNRRYFASTEKALAIIKEDGGVTSFNFEFTEWGHVIKETPHPVDVKEVWFLANSTHVVDLAFFLGGFPKKISSYIKGSLDWHKCGCVYAGAGVSDRDALFTYQANWAAPGRWGIEILTSCHRLFFRPMEELSIQNIGSVAINKVEIDDSLDKKYKPGFFKQTEAFIKRLDDGKRITIQEQLAHMDIYNEMEKFL